MAKATTVTASAPSAKKQESSKAKGAKKVVDKWKSKTWYQVYGPDIFEQKEIAQVPATEDANLENRILQITLADLTGDMTQTYMNLLFRVSEVKGKSVYTKLIGHFLSPSYMRSLVRRRRSIVDEIVDVVTKDGVKIRVKISVFTAKRLSTGVRTAMRLEMRAELIEHAKNTEFNTFEQEIIFGKFSSKLYKAVKRVAPVKRVEIRKTEVEENFST